MSKRQKTVLVVISLLCLSLVVQFSPAAADSPREILRLGRGTANALDWRPDGKVLAVGSATGIWLYDENFEPLAHFENSSVYAVRWNPSGDKLAFADKSGVHIWAIADDAKSHNEVFTLLEDRAFTSLNWSPKGQQIAISNYKYGVQIWDTKTGKLMFELQEAAQEALWSPDGSKLAAPGVNNQPVRIWDGMDGKLLETLKGVEDDVDWTSIAWSPDGKLLAGVSSRLVSVHVWNVDSGELVNKPAISNALYWLQQVLWSSDGKQLIVIGNDITLEEAQTGSIEIYDAARWEDPKQLYIPQIQAISLHPQHSFITGLDFEGAITDWNFTSGEIESTHQLHTNSFSTLIWNPDGSKIAATYGSTLSVWALADQTKGLVSQPSFSLDTQVGTYGSGSVEVHWTTPNEFISVEQTFDDSGNVLPAILKRDATSGEIRERLLQGTAVNCSYTISTLLNKVACHEVGIDRLLILDVPSGAELQVLSIDNPGFLNWSPDDRVIAVERFISQENSLLVELREVENDAVVFSYRPGNYSSLPVWSSDGNYVAAPIYDGQASKLHILRTATYEEIATTPAGDQYTWSPDSSVLAVLQSDGVMFYEAQTGSRIKTISTKGVTALAFSPDGTMLALGMDDGTIRIWDVSDLQ